MGAEKRRRMARGKVAGRPSTGKNVARICGEPKPVGVIDLDRPMTQEEVDANLDYARHRALVLGMVLLGDMASIKGVSCRR